MTTIKPTLTTKKEFGKLRFRVLDGRGVQLYYKSGIIVRASIWDEKGGRISPRKNCDTNERARVNVAIAETARRLLSVYERNKGTIRTSADLARLMDGGSKAGAGTDGKKDLQNLWARFLATKEERARQTYIGYRQAGRAFLRFAELEKKKRGTGASSLDVDTFTADDFARFAAYAADERRELQAYPELWQTAGRVKRGGRGSNSVTQYVYAVRSFFIWCSKAGITDNAPQRNYTPKRQVYAEPFFLTKAERDAVQAFDLSARPQLAAARDVFIFHCYIGCRAGDLLRLTNDNVRGRFLEYTPQKTRNAAAVVKSLRVPLHPVAEAILQRYKGQGKGGRLLPFPPSTDKYNKAIKQILAAAGITRKVQTIDKETHGLTYKPLCEVASSHTARKTFAGILYTQTRDPNLVCALTGHVQGSKAFLRYRKIDDKANEDTIRLL